MPINYEKNGCHEVVKHSIISFKEQGSKVKLDIENPDRDSYIKTKVDGCYFQNEEASDYMLSCCSTQRSLLVELKGNNTAKGCDQLISTYTRLKKQGVLNNNEVPAVLIGTQVRPKARSSVATRKLKYMRLAKKEIHVHNMQHKAFFSSFF